MRRPLVTIVVLVVAGLVPAVALGGPGDLDPSFGIGGSTLTALGAAFANVAGLAPRAGGGFVVAASPASAGLSLVAYTPAGALDTSFNATGSQPGTVTTAVGDSSAARSVAVQADGKIVVAGNSQLGAAQRLVVQRYSATGALDPGFGTGGTLVLPVSVESVSPRGLAVNAADGTIVVAATETSSTITERGLVVRLTAGGALDTTFNPSGTTPGERELTVGSDAKTSLFGLALDGSGRPVISGSASDAGVRKALLLRLTTTGTNDAGFGALATPGATLTDFGASSELDDVVLDSSGRPVATGGAANQVLAARYTTTGALDTSFNGTGSRLVAAGTVAKGFGVALDSAGRVVVAGRGTTGGGQDATLVDRLTSAGAVDPAFTHGAGLTGPELASLGDGNSSTAVDLVVGPDDLPVTAGGALDASKTKVAIARFGGTNQSPTASFTFAPTAPRQNQTVTFDGTGSSDPDGTIVSYQWDFDGVAGFEATGAHPTHAFPIAGANPVTLRVTDNRGTTADTTISVPVTLNQAPSASFTIAPSQVLRGVTETLDAGASADPDGTIASYAWDFTDDGTFDTTTGQPTVTHAYAALGSTRTRLRVTDNEGKSTDATQTFTVANRPPVASFTASLQGKLASFDASASSDPDGAIAQYRWDFDDDGFVDATTTTPTTTHPYAHPGPVTARLVVVDGDNATDENTRALTVTGAAPTAKLTATPDAVQPKYDVKQFSAAGSSDPDGTIASYKWDLDGDGTYETTTLGPSASKVYPAPADVTVSLEVVDDDGIVSAPATAQFAVVDASPHASFTAPSSTQYVNEPVQFDASQSTDPDGDHVIRKYLWDYEGDGTYVEGPVKPLHTYTTYGKFFPRLGVVDEFGAISYVVGSDVSVSSRASFQVVPSDGTDFVVRPGSVADGLFHVVRLLGSTGKVSFTVTGMPKGVTATLEPLASSPDFERLRLTATDAAQPGKSVLTLKATPDHVVGTGAPVTLALSLTVRRTVDVRIRSIDVTQGTQTLDAPPVGAPGSYQSAYSGVRLVAGKRTIVRVLSDAVPDLTNGVKGAYVTLTGTRNGHSLGQPIAALQDPAVLHDSGLTDARTGAGISTFVLPAGWTGVGKIAITAHVTLPVVANLDACGEGVCRLDDDYTLNGLSFELARPDAILPLQSTWSRDKPGGGTESGAVRGADDVFATARVLSPVPDKDNTVHPYIATLYISDIAQLPQHLVPDDPPPATFFGAPLFDVCTLQPGVCHDENGDGGDVKNGLVFDRAGLWLKINDALGPADHTDVGANTIAVNRVLARGLSQAGYKLGGQPHPLAVVDQDRPLTSVAHELFHDFGRAHASKACNGDGDDWQPDQWGYLDGVGFDVRDPLAADAFKVAPNPVEDNAGAGPTGGAGVFDKHQEFDFMSYCARTADDNSWIAPLGWTRTLDLRAAKVGARAAHVAQSGSRSLYVNGFVTRGATAVLDQVAQLPGAPDAQPASDYSVLVRGESGDPVTAPIGAQQSHVDYSGPITLISGSVPLPADGTVASLTLLHEGHEVAQKLASAHGPTVRLRSPRAGAHLRGKTVHVKWAMADADGDALRAAVSYSADGGRTWTVRAMGTGLTSATLPARYFPRSRRAKVRVSVSDGLREATATSGLLRSDGAAPAVHIDPLSRHRISDAATLELSGTAFDDGDRRLTGRALRWRAGRRTLGHGGAITVSGLPAGTRVITLEARDRHGRVGRAVLRLRLIATAPRILVLRAPKRIGRGAGRVSLRIAASPAARLTVSGGRRRVRARVGPRARGISVPVGAGSGSLRLRLRLVASGRHTGTRVTIPRR